LWIYDCLSRICAQQQPGNTNNTTESLQSTQTTGSGATLSSTTAAEPFYEPQSSNTTNVMSETSMSLSTTSSSPQTTDNIVNVPDTNDSLLYIIIGAAVAW